METTNRTTVVVSVRRLLAFLFMVTLTINAMAQGAAIVKGVTRGLRPHNVPHYVPRYVVPVAGARAANGQLQMQQKSIDNIAATYPGTQCVPLVVDPTSANVNQTAIQDTTQQIAVAENIPVVSSVEPTMPASTDSSTSLNLIACVALGLIALVIIVFLFLFYFGDSGKKRYDVPIPHRQTNRIVELVNGGGVMIL